MTFFPWKRALRSRTVWFSLAVMLLFALVSALAPLLAPHDPLRWGISAALTDLPPAWVQGGPKDGSPDYLLGTDRYGRDILSRMIYGARTAFVLGLAAVLLAAVIGTLVGLAAGFAGGKLDQAVLLLIDIVQSLPGIMFLVIIVLYFRDLQPPSWLHGLLALVVGFAAVAWAGLARQVRMQALVVKSQLFVEAAVALGASPWQIITRHLFPNVLHVVLVWMVNNVPAVILMEALLGYVGVGVTTSGADNDFTAISWGGMFFAGRSAIMRNPLILIVPSLCILLISMSFIFLADFLRGVSQPED